MYQSLFFELKGAFGSSSVWSFESSIYVKIGERTIKVTTQNKQDILAQAPRGDAVTSHAQPRGHAVEQREEGSGTQSLDQEARGDLSMASQGQRTPDRDRDHDHHRDNSQTSTGTVTRSTSNAPTTSDTHELNSIASRITNYLLSPTSTETPLEPNVRGFGRGVGRGLGRGRNKQSPGITRPSDPNTLTELEDRNPYSILGND